MKRLVQQEVSGFQLLMVKNLSKSYVENAIEEKRSDDQNAIEKECSGDKNDRVYKKKGKLNDRVCKKKGKLKAKRQHLT